MLGQCQDSVRCVLWMFQLSRVQGSNWILAASVQGQFPHSCHSLLRGEWRHWKPRRTALQVAPQSSCASDSARCLAGHCCGGVGGGGGGKSFLFCLFLCLLLLFIVAFDSLVEAGKG